jgi:hypothetical protein
MTTKHKTQLATVQRKRRRKNISTGDCEAICRLVSCQRFTYLEACETLEINYESWRSWKTRAANEPRFARILARMQGSYLKGRLDNIKDAERGRRGHRPDWRASKALLEIAAPERYLPQQQPPPALPQPAVPATTINMWLAAACTPALPAPSAAEIVDTTEVKALPPAPADPAATSTADSWTPVLLAHSSPRKCPPLLPPDKLPGSA